MNATYASTPPPSTILDDTSMVPHRSHASAPGGVVFHDLASPCLASSLTLQGCRRDDLEFIVARHSGRRPGAVRKSLTAVIPSRPPAPDAMPTSVGPHPTDAANGNATAAYFCRADNAVRAGRKPSRV